MCSCLDYNKAVVFLAFCVIQSCANPVREKVIIPPNTAIMQVPSGKDVTLICQSNDANHNFLYWHMNGRNLVVGPGNDYDNGKYRYEVLSGNLTIRVKYCIISQICVTKKRNYKLP